LIPFAFHTRFSSHKCRGQAVPKALETRHIFSSTDSFTGSIL